MQHSVIKFSVSDLWMFPWHSTNKAAATKHPYISFHGNGDTHRVIRLL